MEETGCGFRLLETNPTSLWQCRESNLRSPFFFRNSDPTAISGWEPLPFGPGHGSWIARQIRSRRDPISTLLSRKGIDEETFLDSALCVSRTKLYDRSRRQSDPDRYVISEAFPYMNLPPSPILQEVGVRLGDLVAVICPATRRVCFAVIGDTHTGVATPSLYLAERLAVGPGMTPAPEWIYLVFPGSGQGQGTIPTLTQLRDQAEFQFGRAPGLGRSWPALLAECFGEARLLHGPLTDHTLGLSAIDSPANRTRSSDEMRSLGQLSSTDP